MTYSEDQLICPSGKPGDPPIVIDLKAILLSEQRQNEVAYVTPMKAPDLLREFNISWRDLNKIVVMLASEHLRAQRMLENRRSVVILDIVPRTIKEKGLSSNDSTREAIVNLDEEFKKLQEVVDELDGVVHYLRGKLKSFENAFTSVKRLIGEDSAYMQGRQNPLLKGDTGGNYVSVQPLKPAGLPDPPGHEPVDQAVARRMPDTPRSSQVSRSGFGKPKY